MALTLSTLLRMRSEKERIAGVVAFRAFLVSKPKALEVLFRTKQTLGSNAPFLSMLSLSSIILLPRCHTISLIIPKRHKREPRCISRIAHPAKGYLIQHHIGVINIRNCHVL